MRVKTLVGVAVVTVGLTAQMASAQAGSMTYVLGDAGANRLSGGPGAQLLGGRGGDDAIRPGPGADIVRAGPGDDYVFLRNDGAVDRIHCGTGFDVVAYRFAVDRHDIIDRNCEGAIA